MAIDLASRNPDKVCWPVQQHFVSQLIRLTQVKALILENTFTSIPALVPHVLPVLGPFTFLCHQKWDSASKVHLIPPTTPVLLLSGARDQIVPQEHMKKLRELFSKRGTKAEERNPAEKSRWEEFEHGSHSKPLRTPPRMFESLYSDFHAFYLDDTTAQRGYWSCIEEFLESLRDKSR